MIEKFLFLYLITTIISMNSIQSEDYDTYEDYEEEYDSCKFSWRHFGNFKVFYKISKCQWPPYSRRYMSLTPWILAQQWYGQNMSLGKIQFALLMQKKSGKKELLKLPSPSGPSGVKKHFKDLSDHLKNCQFTQHTECFVQTGMTTTAL